MDGPLFGIVVMVLMVVGLVWWCWWAYRSDKRKVEEPKIESNIAVDSSVSKQ